MNSLRLIIFCSLLIALQIEGRGQGTRTDSMRIEASQLLRKADSVKAIWDVQWKRSDSLRIESMFLRMRSDSLRRMAQSVLGAIASIENEKRDSTHNTPDSLLLDSAALPMVRKAAAVVRRTTVPSGRTVSDSVTRLVHRVKPDTGMASFYGDQFHGKKTASGEVFNMNQRTCAHRWLPFNTRVRVTNLSNGKNVVVRVTDRGPWKHARLLDLSKQAAKDLDMIRAGTARVAIEVVEESLERERNPAD